MPGSWLPRDCRVGVYKPVASGCRREGNELISDDALALWEAAGRPGTLAEVCPQRFAAPLAPHLAARAEGKRVDAELLRRGLEVWQARSDVVLVEGVGGLMSPLSDEDYVADLAAECKYPLIVVARNAAQAPINQTLQTLIVAATFRHGLPIAGVVLNRPAPPPERSGNADPSLDNNRDELARRAIPPVLAGSQFGDASRLESRRRLAIARRSLAREAPTEKMSVETKLATPITIRSRRKISLDDVLVFSSCAVR